MGISVGSPSLGVPAHAKEQGLRFPGGLYDKVSALSPFWRAFPPPHASPSTHRLRGRATGEGRLGLISGPKARPPLPGETFGFGAAPGIDIAVVARGQHRRNGVALPYLRPCELRVFDQAGGKALIRS